MAHRNLLCVLFVSLLVVLPSLSATQSTVVSLQDVAVAIKTPAGKVIRGSTDPSGRFQFPIDGSGTYSLFFFPDAPVDAKSGVVNRVPGEEGAWFSMAGWPYQFSVEAPAVELSKPVLTEEQRVPVIRMDVVVGTETAPGTLLRGSVRLPAQSTTTAIAAAPQPPKYTKVKVVKRDDTKGCKGDVWVSNGLGMWENNCARGEACCDLKARYDHQTRGAAKKP